MILVWKFYIMRAAAILIIEANAERDKAPMLLALRAQFNELFVLIRLANEVLAFKSFSEYTGRAVRG